MTQEEVKTGPTDAEIASDYFVKASVKCAATVTGQAAYIALLCKENGRDPKELGDALNRDAAELASLRETANKGHSKRVDAQPVPQYRVNNVIKSDFIEAAQLMPLDPAILRLLTDVSYPKYKAEALAVQHRSISEVEVVRRRVRYIDDHLIVEANQYLSQVGAPKLTRLATDYVAKAQKYAL